LLLFLSNIFGAKKAIAAITNTKAVKAQRTEAFIEAYSLIPMNDLYKLQQVLKPDCDLFNYDSRGLNGKASWIGRMPLICKSLHDRTQAS
jgi:hypothetical protein